MSDLMDPCENKNCMFCAGDGTYSHNTMKIKPADVPLFLGEGEDRKEIGIARVEQMANGALKIDMMVAGAWSDPDIMSEAINMRGLIPPELRKD